MTDLKQRIDRIFIKSEEIRKALLRFCNCHFDSYEMLSTLVSWFNAKDYSSGIAKEIVNEYVDALDVIRELTLREAKLVEALKALAIAVPERGDGYCQELDVCTEFAWQVLRELNIE